METEPSRYCLKCGYALVVATGYQCPECGQKFHPDHPITYNTHSPQPLIKSIISFFVYSLISSCLFMLLLHTVDSFVVSITLDVVQVTGGLLLFTILAYLGFSLSRVSSLICAAVGICCGYFFAMVIAVSIRQSHIALDLPGDLIGLAILSIVVTLAVLPIYVLRSGYRKRKRALILSSPTAQT